MHLTLRETARPAAVNVCQQKVRFNDVIDQCNREWSDQALATNAPADARRP
jgi:hypothetical protein